MGKLGMRVILICFNHISQTGEWVVVLEGLCRVSVTTTQLLESLPSGEGPGPEEGPAHPFQVGG